IGSSIGAGEYPFHTKDIKKNPMATAIITPMPHAINIPGAPKTESTCRGRIVKKPKRVSVVI
ncbi:MAG: hypothetical protein QSU88_08405, partial [Candidatus Methanoperedens sp.]|nr:hypothetical protein [Candidatus Methanoperedens sp.]